ncbi:MAG: polyprenol monophosphomannose synthase [Candidatus Sumerlaeia bacterium]|nr:polyprenol monophosphomannose synthase [Candidatus Sumerlaeia bacterium]
MNAVVIATYNERENLVVLLPALFAAVPGARVFIVDDNSPDGTAKVPAELGLADAQAIVRTRQRGYGTAVRDGLLAAVEAGAERVVTMDADLSHDPADVPRMFAALENADLAIGSRYAGGVRVLNWGVRRLLLSLFANYYVRSILGFSSYDNTSGFRAFRGTLLRRMPLRRLKSNGYSFIVEVLELARRARAKVVEVPIIYSERREGQSKMSNAVIAESVAMPWRLRLSRLAARRR